MEGPLKSHWCTVGFRVKLDHFWGFGDWPHFETPIFIEGVTGISWFWDAQIELLRYWHSSPYSSEVLPQWWGRSNQCLVLCLVLALDREWLLKFTIFIKLAWTKHLRISWDDLSLSSQILGCKCWFFICVLHLCCSCFSVATLSLFKVILLIQRFKLEALKPSTRHSALPISVRFPIFVVQTKRISLQITRNHDYGGGNFGNLQ